VGETSQWKVRLQVYPRGCIARGGATDGEEINLGGFVRLRHRTLRFLHAVLNIHWEDSVDYCNTPSLVPTVLIDDAMER
jgi:hypothetical protein